VYGAVVGILALQGKRKVEQATPLVTEEAAESVKEDVQWAKGRHSSRARWQQRP
jgi:hypothetical protein